MAALECECPVIAAVNGAAVGWGMELALFADIRIASDKAKFAELFVKRGLVCDVGGFYRLPAIVGPAKAAELLFTGEVIDAAEALRIGLVSEVVAHDALLARARELASRIAAKPATGRARAQKGPDAQRLWRPGGDRWLGHRRNPPPDEDRGSPRRRRQLPGKAPGRVQGTLEALAVRPRIAYHPRP